MHPPAGIADAADENLTSYLIWGHPRAPGMRVESSEHLVIADSGLDSPLLNTVSRARFPRHLAGEWIANTRQRFDNGQRPFSWWVGPSDMPSDLAALLVADGFDHIAVREVMVTDPQAVRAPASTPMGLQIRPVKAPADLEAFAAIHAATWAPTVGHDRTILDSITRRVLHPGHQVRYFVGYLDGVPVATSELVVTGSVGGLYALATLEAHRGQGVGTAMAVAPLQEAAQLGCRAVVADVDEVAGSICRGLGFTTFGQRQVLQWEPR